MTGGPNGAGARGRRLILPYSLPLRAIFSAWVDRFPYPLAQNRSERLFFAPFCIFPLALRLIWCYDVYYLEGEEVTT